MTVKDMARDITGAEDTEKGTTGVDIKESTEKAQERHGKSTEFKYKKIKRGRAPSASDQHAEASCLSISSAEGGRTSSRE